MEELFKETLNNLCEYITSKTWEDISMNIKKIFITIFTLFLLFSAASCGNKTVTVQEAIYEIGVGEKGVDKSKKYDLDERFYYFNLFNANGAGWLFLNNEEGILTISFNCKENEDGSVECTITEIYINIPNKALGPVANIDKIKEYIGDDIVFTLTLENNIVTSHDLPELV